MNPGSQPYALVYHTPHVYHPDLYFSHARSLVLYSEYLVSAWEDHFRTIIRFHLLGRLLNTRYHRLPLSSAA